MDTTAMVVTGILVVAGIGFLYYKFGSTPPKPEKIVATPKSAEKPVEKSVEPSERKPTERPPPSPKGFLPVALRPYVEPVNPIGCWKEIDGDSAFSFKKNGKCLLSGSAGDHKQNSTYEVKEGNNLHITGERQLISGTCFLKGETLGITFQDKTFQFQKWPKAQRLQEFKEQLEKDVDSLSGSNLEKQVFLNQQKFLINIQDLDVPTRESMQPILDKLIAKLTPLSDLFYLLEVSGKRVTSILDPIIVGKWRLTQGNLHFYFDFTSDGQAFFPVPGKPIQQCGSFLTFQSAIPRIEVFMKGETSWKKGIYKVEGTKLSLQWAAPGQDTPTQFGANCFVLEAATQSQGDKIPRSQEFIKEFTKLLQEILNPQELDTETKKEFINILMNPETAVPEFLFPVLANFASQESRVLQLESLFEVKWSAIRSSSDPEITSSLDQMQRTILSS